MDSPGYTLNQTLEDSFHNDESQSSDTNKYETEV